MITDILFVFEKRNDSYSEWKCLDFSNIDHFYSKKNIHLLETVFFTHRYYLGRNIPYDMNRVSFELGDWLCKTHKGFCNLKEFVSSILKVSLLQEDEDFYNIVDLFLEETLAPLYRTIQEVSNTRFIIAFNSDRPPVEDDNVDAEEYC